MSNAVESAYRQASERYAELGVNTDQVLEKLATIPISMHCWQGDDVSGFENPDGDLGGGIQATGNYPGKATNACELRSDLDQALALIPGTQRLNLHAIYAETDGRKVERNQLQPEHFANWIEWAKTRHMGLDFNGSFFSHPMADSGFTLASPDEGIRQFWIEHGQACRKIAAVMGAELGSPCVTNVWIPDGYKDMPADRLAPRQRLQDSLDRLFEEDYDTDCLLDAVECKLFGIGSESYVVGSHEFYMGYALSRQKLLCLDMGHFHPTEQVSDKISSLMLFLDEILLHVSRGVRWDSDHVVTLSDELRTLAKELVRGDFLGRTHIGLDFFDASINRIAAWVIGTRCMQKSLLEALLEPSELLRNYESAGDFAGRLALNEELKTMPLGAVWDYHCLRQNVPVGMNWLAEVKTYEKNVLAKR
jgi:L-rhamnose isomerase